jgi:hypothetical protein
MYPTNQTQKLLEEWNKRYERGLFQHLAQLPQRLSILKAFGCRLKLRLLTRQTLPYTYTWAPTLYHSRIYKQHGKVFCICKPQNKTLMIRHSHQHITTALGGGF